MMDTVQLLLLLNIEGDLLRLSTRFKSGEMKSFYRRLHADRLIERDTRAESGRIWRLTDKGREVITPAEVS